MSLEQVIMALKNGCLHGVNLEREDTRTAVLEWLEELKQRREAQEPRKVNVLIETTDTGGYCSSEIIQDTVLANEIMERYKSSKQGYRHCYHIEEQHIG